MANSIVGSLLRIVEFWADVIRVIDFGRGKIRRGASTPLRRLAAIHTRYRERLG